MNFIESVTTCLIKSFTFSGRASRSEYWWFVLFNIIFTKGADLIVKTMSLSEWNTEILSLLISLSLLPAAFSVSVRRLHDVNRSGWWIWTPMISVILILSVYISSFGIFVEIRHLIVLYYFSIWSWLEFVIIIIGIIPHLYWSIKRGTDGKNDYGNSPI